MALVSLFVLTGYACDVLDYGCAGEKQEQQDHSKFQGKNAPDKKDDCQCICHQTYMNDVADPACRIPAIFSQLDFIAGADEFPPDTVPLGIDYPPRLA